MLVVNLATTLSGGAGIGMMRYHNALVAAGVDSRIIVGLDTEIGDARVAVSSRKTRSLPWRLARRAGVPLDPAMRILTALERSNSVNGHKPNYEIFSPPFSDCTPEDHPWIEKADLLNLHWVAGMVDWPRFFRKIRKPVIITLHDQQPYLGGFHYARDLENNPRLRGLDDRVRAIKQSALCGRQITVIGNSKWNTRDAEASGFFPEGSRFHTVYYPLDKAAYAPRLNNAAREAFGVEPGRKMIGFACEGIGNQRKGFDVLLEALKNLPASLVAQCCLLSFGRDPNPQTKSSISMPWLHLGYLQADAVKAAAYSAMDLFVVPSRAEAFGQTAIEALACGTPVVGSRTGGLPEALFEGECGMLFENGNSTALADAIASLLLDPRRCRKLADEGRRLVSERHDPASIGKQYYQLCLPALR